MMVADYEVRPTATRSGATQCRHRRPPARHPLYRCGPRPYLLGASTEGLAVEPAIRTATLSGYGDVARSVGLDPAALLAAVGLDAADLEVPDRWVPGAQAARLLELSAERSGREDFALRLAEHRALGTLGPLS